MTHSSTQRGRAKGPVVIALAVAAVLLVALFAGTGILFDRSMREPIEGAYDGAPKGPAIAARQEMSAEVATTTR